MMRMPSKLSWTLNRLRCMSAGEVAHRLGKSVQARVESATKTYIFRRPDLLVLPNNVAL